MADAPAVPRSSRGGRGAQRGRGRRSTTTAAAVDPQTASRKPKPVVPGSTAPPSAPPAPRTAAPRGAGAGSRGAPSSTAPPNASSATSSAAAATSATDGATAQQRRRRRGGASARRRKAAAPPPTENGGGATEQPQKGAGRDGRPARGGRAGGGASEQADATQTVSQSGQPVPKAHANGKAAQHAERAEDEPAVQSDMQPNADKAKEEEEDEDSAGEEAEEAEEEEAEEEEAEEEEAEEAVPYDDDPSEDEMAVADEAEAAPVEEKEKDKRERGAALEEALGEEGSGADGTPGQRCLDVLNKRLRALRKRMGRIEQAEALQASEPRHVLERDQQEALARKNEVALLMREFEEVKTRVTTIDKQESTKAERALKLAAERHDAAITSAVRLALQVSAASRSFAAEQLRLRPEGETMLQGAANVVLGLDSADGATLDAATELILNAARAPAAPLAKVVDRLWRRGKIAPPPLPAEPPASDDAAAATTAEEVVNRGAEGEENNVPENAIEAQVEAVSIDATGDDTVSDGSALAKPHEDATLEADAAEEEDDDTEDAASEHDGDEGRGTAQPETLSPATFAADTHNNTAAATALADPSEAATGTSVRAKRSVSLAEVVVGDDELSFGLAVENDDDNNEESGGEGILDETFGAGAMPVARGKSQTLPDAIGTPPRPTAGMRETLSFGATLPPLPDLDDVSSETFPSTAAPGRPTDTATSGPAHAGAMLLAALGGGGGSSARMTAGAARGFSAANQPSAPTSTADAASTHTLSPYAAGASPPPPRSPFSGEPSSPPRNRLDARAVGSPRYEAPARGLSAHAQSEAPGSDIDAKANAGSSSHTQQHTVEDSGRAYDLTRAAGAERSPQQRGGTVPPSRGPPQPHAASAASMRFPSPYGSQPPFPPQHFGYSHHHPLAGANGSGPMAPPMPPPWMTYGAPGPFGVMAGDGGYAGYMEHAHGLHDHGQHDHGHEHEHGHDDHGEGDESKAPQDEEGGVEDSGEGKHKAEGDGFDTGRAHFHPYGGMPPPHAHSRFAPYTIPVRLGYPSGSVPPAMMGGSHHPHLRRHAPDYMQMNMHHMAMMYGGPPGPAPPVRRGSGSNMRPSQPRADVTRNEDEGETDEAYMAGPVAYGEKEAPEFGHGIATSSADKPVMDAYLATSYYNGGSAYDATDSDSMAYSGYGDAGVSDDNMSASHRISGAARRNIEAPAASHAGSYYTSSEQYAHGAGP